MSTWIIKQKIFQFINGRDSGLSVLKLAIHHSLPAGFLDSQPQDIAEIFSQPALVFLDGIRKDALFVSIFLHGNETSGFLALQQLLSRYRSANQELPRSIILFIGNPRAAEKGVRHLESQLDYNRIWSGGETPEHKFAQEVLEQAAACRLFAAVDVHNNTGKNPLYGCINCLQNKFFHLAELFSQTTVYFRLPKEVISAALAKLCPAITLECGMPGESRGITRAVEYLEACLQLDKLSDKPLKPGALNLYHTLARIKVGAESSVHFSIDNKGADFSLMPGIEQLNFSKTIDQTFIGWRSDAGKSLILESEEGINIADELIKYKGCEIYLMPGLVPAMLTSRIDIIRKDCLGYLMEEVSVDQNSIITGAMTGKSIVNL